eukprot:gene1527-2942_t
MSDFDLSEERPNEKSCIIEGVRNLTCCEFDLSKGERFNSLQIDNSFPTISGTGGKVKLDVLSSVSDKLSRDTTVESMSVNECDVRNSKIIYVAKDGDTTHSRFSYDSDFENYNMTSDPVLSHSQMRSSDVIMPPDKIFAEVKTISSQLMQFYFVNGCKLQIEDNKESNQVPSSPGSSEETSTTVDFVSGSVMSEERDPDEEENWDDMFEGELNTAHVDSFCTSDSSSLSMSLPLPLQFLPSSSGPSSLSRETRTDTVSGTKTKTRTSSEGCMGSTTRTRTRTRSLSQITALRSVHNSAVNASQNSNINTSYPSKRKHLKITSQSKLTSKKSGVKGLVCITPDNALAASLLQQQQHNGMSFDETTLSWVPATTSKGFAPIKDYDITTNNGGGRFSGCDIDDLDWGDELDIDVEVNTLHVQRQLGDISIKTYVPSTVETLPIKQQNVPRSNTRVSSVSDFELSETEMDAIVTSELTHRAHMLSVMGEQELNRLLHTGGSTDACVSSTISHNRSSGPVVTNGRSKSERSTSSPSQQSQSQQHGTTGATGAPTPMGKGHGMVGSGAWNKNRNTCLSQGTPTWLKGSGPVIGLHTVELDVHRDLSKIYSISNNNDDTPTHTPTPVPVQRKGEDGLLHAKLGKRRLATLRSLWEFAINVSRSDHDMLKFGAHELFRRRTASLYVYRILDLIEKNISLLDCTSISVRRPKQKDFSTPKASTGDFFTTELSLRNHFPESAEIILHKTSHYMLVSSFFRCALVDICERDNPGVIQLLILKQTISLHLFRLEED